MYIYKLSDDNIENTDTRVIVSNGLPNVIKSFTEWVKERKDLFPSDEDVRVECDVERQVINIFTVYKAIYHGQEDETVKTAYYIERYPLTKHKVY